MGCHLAGACPYEALDISPWAEAAFQHFLHHPLAQRLPRKFKINFSGCETDCGQAMFNDVGVIATTRTLDDGTREAGFRVFVAGGLGANPHPALALEEFTPREDLHGHARGDPPGVLQPRQPRQQAPGPHEVARRHDGLGRAAGPHPQGAQVPRRVAPPGRAASPRPSQKHGDAPAGLGAGRHAHRRSARARRSRSAATTRTRRWDDANVVRGVAKGTVSAIAYARLGDITTAQFRALASIQRELGAEVRITNRQNLVFRGLTESQLPIAATSGSTAIGMAEPGAELARDVVACPGADTCNLAVTQSRGLADAIGAALDEAGLADVGGIRTNISGCTNSCGQHHISDIGFFGAERRAHGQSAPGYQMLLGGYVGQEKIHFGEKALRLPGQERARGRRAGRPPVQRRAPGRRGLPRRGWTASGGVEGDRRGRSRTSTSSRSPTTAPSTTSTTARPGPTSPRPATRSARHERRRARVRGAGLHRRGAGRAQPRVRAPARVEDHPVGGRQLRPPPVASARR